MLDPGALYFRSLQSRIGVPQPVDPPEVRRPLDQLRKSFYLVILEPLTIWATVEYLQRSDLVFVFSNELLERVHQSPRLLQRLRIETGLDHLVGAHRVD